MPRRAPTLQLEEIIAGLEEPPHTPEDDATTALLDAATALLNDYGIRRWSMEDVAERAGLGRATVYRRFETRDELIHAALARDARRFFAAIADAVTDIEPIEDKLVEGFLMALRAVRSSLVPSLIQSDTTKALHLLTAAPVLALARAALVDRYQAITGQKLNPDEAERAHLIAEALVRLGLSFVLMPDSVIPIDDDATARDALGRLIRPLLDQNWTVTSTSSAPRTRRS